MLGKKTVAYIREPRKVRDKRTVIARSFVKQISQGKKKAVAQSREPKKRQRKKGTVIKACSVFEKSRKAAAGIMCFLSRLDLV